MIARLNRERSRFGNPFDDADMRVGVGSLKMGRAVQIEQADAKESQRKQPMKRQLAPRGQTPRVFSNALPSRSRQLQSRAAFRKTANNAYPCYTRSSGYADCGG